MGDELLPRLNTNTRHR